MKRLVLLIAVFQIGCTTESERGPLTRDEILADNGSNFGSVVAAKKVVDGLEDRVRNGEPATLAFLELQYTWSRRLAEAECESSANGDEMRAAVQRHLERMNHLHERLAHMTDANNLTVISISQTEYYVAEAHHWLASIKAK